jgi:hypothetical protein
MTNGKRAAVALEEEEQQEEDSSPEVYGTDDEGEREENAEDANTRGRGYVASAALMMLREPVRLMRRQLAALGHVPGLITHARAAVCMPFHARNRFRRRRGKSASWRRATKECDTNLLYCLPTDLLMNIMDFFAPIDLVKTYLGLKTLGPACNEVIRSRCAAEMSAVPGYEKHTFEASIVRQWTVYNGAIICDDCEAPVSFVEQGLDVGVRFYRALLENPSIHLCQKCACAKGWHGPSFDRIDQLLAKALEKRGGSMQLRRVNRAIRIARGASKYLTGMQYIRERVNIGSWKQYFDIYIYIAKSIFRSRRRGTVSLC